MASASRARTPSSVAVSRRTSSIALSGTIRLPTPRNRKGLRTAARVFTPVPIFLLGTSILRLILERTV
eukprot:9589645-Heterocapsa_arctica.AAC.1